MKKKFVRDWFSPIVGHFPESSSGLDSHAPFRTLRLLIILVHLASPPTTLFNSFFLLFLSPPAGNYFASEPYMVRTRIVLRTRRRNCENRAINSPAKERKEDEAYVLALVSLVLKSWEFLCLAVFCAADTNTLARVLAGFHGSARIYVSGGNWRGWILYDKKYGSYGSPDTITAVKAKSWCDFVDAKYRRQPWNKSKRFVKKISLSLRNKEAMS